MHHVSRHCAGKASAQDFCARVQKLALLSGFESSQEVAFHVEDGDDFVAGNDGD